MSGLLQRFPSSIVGALETQRHGECQPGPHFVDRMAIGQCMAKGGIDGKLVIDLPRSDRPVRRSFLPDQIPFGRIPLRLASPSTSTVLR